MPPGIIAAIYIASRAGAAVAEMSSVHAVPERGLAGDRYFDGAGTFSRWPGSGRAVSLIEQEALDAIARECGGIDLSAGRHRRNLVTRGVALADLNGRKFRVGSAVLRGARLCTECRYLERLAGPGVFAALKGRGGLRTDVVEPGEIRTGDPVEPL
jgi:MOSC domain-containing protein YiiM